MGLFATHNRIIKLTHGSAKNRGVAHLILRIPWVFNAPG